MSRTLADRTVEAESVMKRHNVRLPEPIDFTCLKEQAQPLIAAPIASNGVVQAVHNHSGQCLFLIDDTEGGFGGGALLVPMTKAGAYHIISGNHLGHVVDLSWICQPAQTPRAILVWALIGKNTWYSGKMLRFCKAMRNEVHYDIPVIAYAATDDGARIMPRIGFKPMAGSNTIFQWNPDSNKEKRYADT